MEHVSNLKSLLDKTIKSLLRDHISLSLLSRQNLRVQHFSLKCHPNTCERLSDNINVKMSYIRNFASEYPNTRHLYTTGSNSVKLTMS